jgi:hypothetical protein
LPCRGSLDLQKTLHIRIKEEKIIIITLHINDKVQAESQVISDSQEKKMSNGWAFQGRLLHWTVEPGGPCLARSLCSRQTGQLADAQEGPVLGRVGASFPKRETSWQMCRLHKEAGVIMPGSNVPLFFLLLGSDYSRGAEMQNSPEMASGSSSTASN